MRWPIEFVPRDRPPGIWLFLTPVLALAGTLLTGTLMFLALGHEPVTAFQVFFYKPLTSVNGVAELLIKASPLVLCAIGLAIGFKANVWNIGAEGQLTIGALAGGGLAIAFHESESYWLLPAMLIASIVGGMLWASIPALLKTHFKTNEILTSLMLVYVALLVLSWLIHGPWRDPDGYNFPESRLFPEAALLPRIVTGTRLHAGVLITLAVAAVAWVFLSRSVPGYAIRVLVWLVFLISGGLAGLAGIFELAGPIGQIVPKISPGYGFAAIIVAFLGRLHPVGIVIAGLVLALSYIGGERLQIEMGLPLAVAGVFQGLLLFFLLASDVLLWFTPRWRKRSSYGLADTRS